MNKEFNFLVYSAPDKDIKVSAVIKDETIWLTQKAMAELFGVQTPAISKHLKNIFEEKELDNKWLFPKWKQPLSMVLLLIKRKLQKLIFTILMP